MNDFNMYETILVGVFRVKLKAPISMDRLKSMIVQMPITVFSCKQIT